MPLCYNNLFNTLNFFIIKKVMSKEKSYVDVVIDRLENCFKDISTVFQAYRKKSIPKPEIKQVVKNVKNLVPRT